MVEKTENSSTGKTFTLPDGLVISWEDKEFLKHIREIEFGEIEKVQIVNGKVQMFKRVKKSIKIF